MRLWHILRSRCRSLFRRTDRESDLREELEFHLAQESERLQAGGLSADQARRQAARSFGALEPTKEECRDARGMAVVDGLVRDARYAWRSFRKAPLAAGTIVATVGVGLGLVTVVFTVLNAYVFRVDAVRHPEELYAIEREPAADGGEPRGFTREQYEALLRDTDLFSGLSATTRDVETSFDGRRREGRLVSGNFFRLLGVTALRGRTLEPSDDEQQTRALVLSHRAWTQYLAADPGVLDRPVLLNGARFTVVGIMPENFRGLEPVVAPDFWAPLSLLDALRPGDRASLPPAGLHPVGRLKPGVSVPQAVTRLRAWDVQQPLDRPPDQPRRPLVLEPRSGTIPMSADAMLAFVPLFFAFGLILVIGCANVANLLLARSVARQHEIGIRLAIGASRRRIVRQLLTENLLLALASAALAFVISRLFLAGLVYAVTTTFPPDIGNLRLAVPPADWRVVVFLLGGAAASTMGFALAPALQATRVELVRAIRGEVVRDARPGRARSLLVALQVTGSVLLLIAAGIFLRSSWAASRVDPGIRTDGIISLRLTSERPRSAAIDLLTHEPLIATLAASWPGEVAGLGGLPAYAQVQGGRVEVTYQFASPEFFGLFAIDLVRGRGFAPAERTVADAVTIVSEKTARQLWPNADPIGQVLRLEPDLDRLDSVEGGRDINRADNPRLLPRTAAVVGVAADVAGIRLGGMRLGQIGVYLPIGAEADGAVFTAGVRGDTERAREVIGNRLAAIDPGAGRVSTLRTIADAEVYLLSIPFWLTLGLGILALLLTLSGLFGVLSYVVEQRTREIGVRIALGATASTIGRMVLAQSARPVGIGVAIGVALAAALAAALLASPAAEAIGSTVRVLDPLAYGGSLLCIVAACAGATLIPALRAGRINPLRALRHD